jgi:hypothetical protein
VLTTTRVLAALMSVMGGIIAAIVIAGVVRARISENDLVHRAGAILSR